MLKRQPPSFSSFETGGAFPFRARRRMAGILLLTVLTTGQACYSYHATQLPEIVPGEEVRVSLEETGYRRLAPGAAQERSPRLEGRFAGVRNDSLALSVWIGEAYLGTPFESTRQDLMIPLIDVQRLENRRLSRARTALVATGIAAAIVVLIESIGVVNLWGNGGGDGLPDPPDPEGWTVGAWWR